jgi:hypothetical protein
MSKIEYVVILWSDWGTNDEPPEVIKSWHFATKEKAIAKARTLCGIVSVDCDCVEFDSTTGRYHILTSEGIDIVEV